MRDPFLKISSEIYFFLYSRLLSTDFDHKLFMSFDKENLPFIIYEYISCSGTEKRATTQKTPYQQLSRSILK